MLWVYERRRNARELPSRNMIKKKRAFFPPKHWGLLPLLIQIYCHGVKWCTIFRTHWVFTNWLSAECILPTLPLLYWSALRPGPNCISEEWKRAGNSITLRVMWWHCNSHWGDTDSVPTGFVPKSRPVRLRREQCLWAALQRAAMLGCTSLNVWIQCIQAGDFTTNSERQQSTEGVQAWSWEVAW